MEKFDITIVGINLAGSIAAYKLSNSGKKIALIQSDPEDSDYIEDSNWNGFTLEKNPCYFSSSETLNELEEELSIELKTIRHETVPLLFNSGKFAPLSKSSLKSEEIDTDLDHQANLAFEPLGGFKKIADLLTHHENITIIKDRDIQSISSNDGFKIEFLKGKPLFSRLMIWSAPVKRAEELLSFPGLVQNSKKIPESPKSKWTYIKMDFGLKSPITDFIDPVLIPLVSKDKSQGFLEGLFYSNRNPGLAPRNKQLCSWWARLSEEEEESNQLIRAKMRHIKRLIEKAFPKFQDRVIWSRINIVDKAPLSFESFSDKSLIDSTDTPIRGLFLAGPMVKARKAPKEMSQENGLLLQDLSVYSSLEAAEKALSL